MLFFKKRANASALLKRLLILKATFHSCGLSYLFEEKGLGLVWNLVSILLQQTRLSLPLVFLTAQVTGAEADNFQTNELTFPLYLKFQYISNYSVV